MPRLSMKPLTATRSIRFVLARYSVSKTVWPDVGVVMGFSNGGGEYVVLLLLLLLLFDEVVEMGDVGGVIREKVR